MISDVAVFSSLKYKVERALADNDIKVVSFDVFDTLLHRRCDPDAVLAGVSSWLERRVDDFGIIKKRSAAESRDIAYGLVTAENINKGHDCDTTISKFAPVWIDELCEHCDDDQKNELVSGLLEKEVDLEMHACYENIYTHGLIQSLKAKNLRIIYVSDMYLGNEIITRMLDENGYKGCFAAGYVSGDEKLLKRTGRLFERVLMREGVDGNQVLHIGDNYQADYLMARKAGVNAIHIDDARLTKKRNQHYYDLHMAYKDDTWKGYAIASYAASSPSEISNYLQSYGKRVYGPVFSSFVHKVIERCIEENIERVYFLSREGFLLEEVAKKIYRYIPHVNEIGEFKYLYVSRLVTYLACMRTIGLREIRSVHENVGGLLTIRSLLAPLKLDEGLIYEIAERHGLGDIDEVLPGYYLQWSPFINFINDKQLQSIVEQKSNDARMLLENYLEQEGFFSSERVAIVDVGWGGQIQENITQAFRHRTDMPQIFGIYLATNTKAHTRKTPNSWMEWVLADQSHKKWAGNAAFDYVQSLEAISRAPHPTVVGFEEKRDGQIVPVFKSEAAPSRIVEAQDDLNISVIQQGVLDYADSYAYGMQIYSACANDTLNYAATAIEYALRFPNKREAESLLKIRNASDLGTDSVFDISSHNLKFYFSIRKIKHAIISSFWPYGTMAYLMGKPMQLYFFVKNTVSTTPSRDVGLAPGMVWTAPIQTRKRYMPNTKMPEFGDNSAIFANYMSNYKIGKNKFNAVLARNYDSPISSSHILISYFIYRLVNGYIHAFTNKHKFIYDGVSAKYILGRIVYPAIRSKPYWVIVQKLASRFI